MDERMATGQRFRLYVVPVFAAIAGSFFAFMLIAGCYVAFGRFIGAAHLIETHTSIPAFSFVVAILKTTGLPPPVVLKVLWITVAVIVGMYIGWRDYLHAKKVVAEPTDRDVKDVHDSIVFVWFLSTMALAFGVGIPLEHWGLMPTFVPEGLRVIGVFVLAGAVVAKAITWIR